MDYTALTPDFTTVLAALTAVATVMLGPRVAIVGWNYIKRIIK